MRRQQIRIMQQWIFEHMIEVEFILLLFSKIPNKFLNHYYQHLLVVVIEIIHKVDLYLFSNKQKKYLNTQLPLI